MYTERPTFLGGRWDFPLSGINFSPLIHTSRSINDKSPVEILGFSSKGGRWDSRQLADKLLVPSSN